MAETFPHSVAANAVPGDDAVLPFQTDDPGIKGRLVRLGPCVDTILKRHNYPDKVSEVLAQAIALTGMLGASLPDGGKLSLQARTDGPVSFIFVDLEAGGLVRATASFNAARVSEAAGAGVGQFQGSSLLGTLLGLGHLALTVEPGEGLERTQGIVALDGGNLTQAAQAYFRQSEQLPTYIRLAVAKHYVAGAQAGGPSWSWRAGGIIVQHLVQPLDDGEGAADVSLAAADTQLEAADNWNRVRILAATVEEHELIDPALAPDRLLYRLFHDEGVRIFSPKPLAVHCRCSRQRVEAFLMSFGREQLSDMHEADGKIAVTCEFCSTVYRFDPDSL